MKLPKVIDDLCQPAYVYFILVSISLLLYVYILFDQSTRLDINVKEYTQKGFLVNLVISIVWIYILDQLCKISPLGKKFAWFFVLLPFLIISLFIIGFSCSLSYMISNQEEMNKINTILYNQLDNQPEQLSQVSGSTVNWMARDEGRVLR